MTFLRKLKVHLFAKKPCVGYCGDIEMDGVTINWVGENGREHVGAKKVSLRANGINVADGLWELSRM